MLAVAFAPEPQPSLRAEYERAVRTGQPMPSPTPAQPPTLQPTEPTPSPSMPQPVAVVVPVPLVTMDAGTPPTNVARAPDESQGGALGGRGLVDRIALNHTRVEIVSHVDSTRPTPGHVLALVRYTEAIVEDRPPLPGGEDHLRCVIRVSGREYRETEDSYASAAGGSLDRELAIPELGPWNINPRLNVIDLPQSAVGQPAEVVFRSLHGRDHMTTLRFVVPAPH